MSIRWLVMIQLLFAFGIAHAVEATLFWESGANNKVGDEFVVLKNKQEAGRVKFTDSGVYQVDISVVANDRIVVRTNRAGSNSVWSENFVVTTDMLPDEVVDRAINLRVIIDGVTYEGIIPEAPQ